MALSIRQAYEKVRTPTRTVRRGRDPNIPVALYQELDELTRRLDGITTLIGANNKSIAAAAGSAITIGGGASPGSDATPTVIETLTEIKTDLAGTAGAANGSTTITIPESFIVLSASIIVESAAGAVTCTPGIYIRGVNRITPAVTVFSTLLDGSTNLYQRAYSFDQILGNTQARAAGIPQGFLNNGFVFARNSSVQFQISGASPNARVFGTLNAVLHKVIT